MRRLHRAPRRQGRALLPDARQTGGRTLRHHSRRLGTPEKPHAVQAAFIAEQAAQCGYCTNGMIMSAKALLDRTPHPTSDQVKAGLAGNLCRCGTHTRILSAVMRAAKV
jgi:aerobic-type carbon monoxide dehydrogenase small subunit (CoxS/CutS family)